jgi:hypothetical protein
MMSSTNKQENKNPFPTKLGDLSGNLFQIIPHPTPTKFYSSNVSRPKIILTSVKIPDEHIWANGLFQNVYVCYRLLESIGYEPYMLVENNKNNNDAKIHKKFRVLDFPEYIAKPFPIVAYIEMAMSCDPSIRKFFKSIGAKTVKVYFGNILNIDIETITFYKQMNFSHHLAGELDEIWTSPHYDFHSDYCGSINGILGKTRIAPYVWDSMFIEENGTKYDSSNIKINSARNFIIMEPNISFQKSSFVPILAIEAYYRKFPERVNEIITINGDKLLNNPYFRDNILPNLHIALCGKLKLLPRANVINLVKAIPDAIVVQHQMNNEYNYSFLEYSTLGFPVVHNIRRFKEYGYYYDNANFIEASNQIENIVKYHDLNKEAYASQANQLKWRFSISNPENQTSWNNLVGNFTNLV